MFRTQICRSCGRTASRSAAQCSGCNTRFDGRSATDATAKGFIATELSRPVTTMQIASIIALVVIALAATAAYPVYKPYLPQAHITAEEMCVRVYQPQVERAMAKNKANGGGFEGYSLPRDFEVCKQTFAELESAPNFQRFARCMIESAEKNISMDCDRIAEGRTPQFGPGSVAISPSHPAPAEPVAEPAASLPAAVSPAEPVAISAGLASAPPAMLPSAGLPPESVDELANPTEEQRQAESDFYAHPYEAVINDPDGYTNVRAAPSTDSAIVARVVVDERFYTQRSKANWWPVITEAGVKGYVHQSRIRILGLRH